MGTAGSANIGSQYAMFEAVHGSAPRMVEEGIEDRANPESLLKAVELMLRHIGYAQKAEQLRRAVDLRGFRSVTSDDGNKGRQLHR